MLVLAAAPWYRCRRNHFRIFASSSSLRFVLPFFSVVSRGEETVSDLSELRRRMSAPKARNTTSHSLNRGSFKPLYPKPHTSDANLHHPSNLTQSRQVSGSAPWAAAPHPSEIHIGGSANRGASSGGRGRGGGFEAKEPGSCIFGTIYYKGLDSCNKVVGYFIF